MDKNEYATEYSTGSVQVPKSYRQPLSLVLLLVLFAGTLVCALGFWGFRLSGLAKRDADTSVRFIKNMRLSPLETDENYAEIQSLGIQGRFLTDLEQHYYNLPRGVYIHAPASSVPELRTGDVLIKINGQPITDWEQLHRLLEQLDPNAPMVLDIYRDGQYQTISPTLAKKVTLWI